MILTTLVKMMTTVNCHTNRILWQIPRRALLVELSTCLESASNSSSSTSRSSAVSLLSVLKAPTVSDLSRYTCTGIVFMVTVILCASKLNC